MKATKKRVLSLLLCLMFLASVGMMNSKEMTVQAAEKVTPSTTEYEVELNIKGNAYLGNKKEVDVTGGEAVYLTYTVDSVGRDNVIKSTQNGLIATQDYREEFPYHKKGTMLFANSKSLLLKPGYTYFIKFEVTEFGFECVVAYSNGEDEGYESGFTFTTGEIKDDMKYCGIWRAESDINARLTHVRCYDSKGNDLGLALKGGTVIDRNFQPNSNIGQHYEFTVNKATSIAISNAKYSDSDQIFMEYEVKDVEENMKQTGFVTTTNPTAEYPFTGDNGSMLFSNIDAESKGELAIPGAKYLLRFTREAEGFTVTARYILNGEEHYLIFPHKTGTYDPKYGYCSIWFSEGTLSGTFFNVKCYDAAGNNLGIQTNKSNVRVMNRGLWEDYSLCEAMYYCSDNNTLITLLKDSSADVQQLGEVATAGTYKIKGTQLTMKLGKMNTDYTYSYLYMTDADSNRYNRLKDYTVKFVTGMEEITRSASMENKYQIEMPEEPSMKGNTFKGWYLGDGTEYKVSPVTTSSQTVYAKWVDGDGNEYLATSVESDAKQFDVSTVTVISVCAATIALTAVGIILILKKERQHNVA